MNCQELNLLLDEQELQRLAANTRAAAQAHLADCAQCARDHEMHLRLAALPVPPLAAERLAAWRGLATADVAARLSRRRRLVLVGAVATLAAAAMLALRLPDWRTQGGAVAATAAELPPVAQAAPFTIDEAVPELAQEPAPAVAPVTAPPTPPAPPAYTLLAMPLGHATDDVVAQAAVRELYAAVLDELRRIPGLEVIGPDASIDPAAKPTDFTLWAEARSARTIGPGSRWEVMLRLRNAERQVVQPIRTAGSLPGECADTGAQAICGPASMATVMLEPLLRLIPVDHGHETYLQARFLDVAQPSAVRLQALNGLRELGAMHRGAGFGPDLVRPLVDVAYKDASEELRLEAVTLLATKYQGNAAAQAALTYIARDDRHPLVRKVAERGVNGIASWRTYSAATARDATLPVAQRLAPLHWMARNGATDDMIAVLDDLLDNDGAAGLAALLSGGGDGATRRQTRDLLDAMIVSRHPATADFWLARFERSADFTSLTGLRAHRDDARVSAKLEQIADGHPDAQLRALAATLLN